MRISIVPVTAVLLFLCLILESAAGIGSSRTSQPLTAPLHVVVPAAPWAFQANGMWHLVYELHLANISSADCTLTKIEVLRPGSGSRPIASLTAASLDGIVAHFGAEVAPPARIPPAGFAVAYMWITVERREDVPVMFFHRITMKIGDYPEELSINTSRVLVNRDPVPVIGPPLRGSDWGAGNGPANDSSHRRGLLPVDGHAYIAERFAIDWLRFTPAGDLYTGDGKDNKSYPGYGSQVLAVADGVITEELDHIPENTPGVADAVPITLETLCGNHLVQRIGKGLYASYCHLQPDSLRVHRGTMVKRGQVVGFVGNSGNSSAPHLHFQLCNANSGCMSGCALCFPFICRRPPESRPIALDEDPTGCSPHQGNPNDGNDRPFYQIGLSLKRPDEFGGGLPRICVLQCYSNGGDHRRPGNLA